MTIDKPSLAALLAQSRKVTANGEPKESTRPFILKDPKSIVKELLAKSEPPKEEDDEDYIQSLMKPEETDEFSFADLTPETEEETPASILKRIMQGK